MFAVFGGVSRVIVCDNPTSLVTRTHLYDLDLNPDNGGLFGSEHAPPTGFEDLGCIAPGKRTGLSGQEELVTGGHLFLALGSSGGRNNPITEWTDMSDQ